LVLAFGLKVHFHRAFVQFSFNAFFDYSSCNIQIKLCYKHFQPASARGIGIKVINKITQVPKKRPVIVQRWVSIFVKYFISLMILSCFLHFKTSI